MNLEFVKDLWLPNIFIYNLKTYKVQYKLFQLHIYIFQIWCEWHYLIILTWEISWNDMK
jgi:hypothetical protein